MRHIAWTIGALRDANRGWPTGQRESEIVEEALRGYLGLGVLEEIWAQNPGDISADAALTLAVDEERGARTGE